MPKPHDPMDAARAQMILSHCFWASILLKLPAIPTERVETIATNGRALFYNPEHFQGLGTLERLTLLAKPVEAIARKHHERRGCRDEKTWNEASAKVILSDLAGCGFQIPEHLRKHVRPEYAGKPVEQVYELIYVEPPQDSGGGGQQKPQDGQGQGQGQSQGQQPQPSPAGSGGAGQGNPNDPLGQLPDYVPDLSGGAGTTLDDPGQQDPGAGNDDGMKIAVAQAMNEAKRRGDLPAHVAREIKEILYPRRSVWDVLREFVAARAKKSADWRQPNRRWIGHGFYMPAKRSDEIGVIAVWLDTSGSVDQRQADVAAGHISQIIGEYEPERTVVYHCDAKVHLVQEFRPGDRIKLTPRGGGGTDCRPVFEAIQKANLDPVAFVGLTDLDAWFPKRAPSYPVLWGVQGTRYDKPPFGRVLRLPS